MRKALFIVLATMVVLVVVSGCAPQIEVIIKETVVVKKVVKETVVVTATPKPSSPTATTVTDTALYITVFDDMNGNKEQEPAAEKLIGNVVVEVYNSLNERVCLLETHPMRAACAHVPGGEYYQVVVRPPQGYGTTTPANALIPTGQWKVGPHVYLVTFGLAKLPTATPTATTAPTSTPAPSKTPTPTSSPEDVLVILEGSLDALRVGGEYIWTAVKLECTLPDGSKLIIPFTGDGRYAIPPGSLVQLWIGDGLGGSGWWSQWYCKTTYTGGGITIHISPTQDQGKKSPYKGRPPPTLAPREPTPTRTPRIAVPTPVGTEPPPAPTHTPPPQSD